MEQADQLFFNAKIYTVDSMFTTAEALVVKGGRILFAGKAAEAEKKYDCAQVVDVQGRTIFPGFIDAHCHFYGYGKGLSELELTGTGSFIEVINALIYYAHEHELYPEKAEISLGDKPWIIGRGWDQNDWPVKEYPDNKRIDSLFPNTPVMLKRVDGHAILVNKKALELAGFDERTKIPGGELLMKNGKLSGVLVDNAADELEKKIPSPRPEKIKEYLLKAQENCLAVGLTTVDDAGLDKTVVDAMDALHKSGELKMRIYAMLTPNNENLDHYFRSKTYKSERLNVCSFKFYGDGALGSHGACLLEKYSDKKQWTGFLLNRPQYYYMQANAMHSQKFQMNVHCIGDSGVRTILQAMASTQPSFEVKEGKLYVRPIEKNLRWRIEHAQVVNKNDLKYFKEYGIIPSVQPTHATSDMYWAGTRLGNERLKDAYAYKELLKAAGVIALGTDFPVEDISPFKTFYAAVYRKDAKGYPEGGFQMENALTREETMRGMTIWAAYSNFEEKEKGSLEKGKFADFVILDTDLMSCGENDILKAKVWATYINGERVFELKQ